MKPSRPRIRIPCNLYIILLEAGFEHGSYMPSAVRHLAFFWKPPGRNLEAVVFEDPKSQDVLDYLGPRAPKVALLRALWSLLDVIWRVLKG